MPKYYQMETPVAVNSDGGSIEYYPEAKRLAISLPFWFDAQGQKCRGKTVSLNIDQFREQAEPLIELLNMAIAELERNGKNEN